MSLYISCLLLLFSQILIPGNDPKKETAAVVLIPFNPDFYISDSDNEIAQRSDLKTEKLKLMFREELDVAISNALTKYQPSRNLLMDSISDARMDIDSLYAIMSYGMTKSAHPKSGPGLNSTLLRLKKKDAANTNEITEIKAPSASDQYMNITFSKPDIFYYLGSKYSSNRYVFINQFEITTRYKTCLDLANRDYEREFTVHYSVYDAKGQQISGAAVTCIYHSNDCDFQGMVQKNFASIGNHIAKSVYQ